MAGRSFFPAHSDATLGEHDTNGVKTAIRCTSDGWFYADIPRSDGYDATTVKDRSVAKLKKLIDEVRTNRGATMNVPFLRVEAATAYRERPLRIIQQDVTGTKQGTAFYLRRGREMSIGTSYDDERYLRVLSPGERDTLRNLNRAVGAAVVTLDEFLDAHKFDFDAAFEAQQRGEYPLEHAPTSDDED